MTAALARLAAFAVELDAAAIPLPVRAVARTALVDTIGVAIAGTTSRPARLARSVVGESAAPGAATILGTGVRVAATGAALANGTAAHALDFDDNCYAGVVHGSAVVVPAALAVAEVVQARGDELLAAIVAGSEVEYAIGEALTTAPYERGWWTTGLLGPVGAAAAASRLLGLGVEATAAALGLAVAGTGGAKSAFGTDGKALLAGRAAEAGVVAALFARAGASGPVDAVESPRGLAALLGADHFDPSVFATLGDRWRLLVPGLDVKRIPLCLSAHAAVDALRDLVAQHRLSTEAVRSITCDVPALVRGNLVHDRPVTATEARFSMPFAMAATLLFGDVTLDHLDERVLAAPRLRELMSRVEMVEGTAWADPARRAAAPEGAVVRVRCGDGTVLEAERHVARGAVADPLSAEEIKAKFLGTAGRKLPGTGAQALLRRLEAVEGLPSVGDLLSEIVWGDP